MKNTRKLIPALAMLLVSAVMMSTASFAWFTMNSEVKAENIEVTAVAPASLWISLSENSGWTSSIDLSNENADAPTHFNPSRTTVDTTPDDETDTSGRKTWDAWTFEQLTQESSAKVTNDGIAPGDAVFEVSKSYFKDTFYLKLDGQAGESRSKVYINVGVSHNLSGDTSVDEIYKALRVAVAVSGTVVVFEPTAVSTDGTIVLSPLASESSTNELVELTAGDSATKVVVYSWIEGSDLDCKNANALNLDTFEVALYFSTKIDAKLPVASGS